MSTECRRHWHRGLLPEGALKCPKKAGKGLNAWPTRPFWPLLSVFLIAPARAGFLGKRAPTGAPIFSEGRGDGPRAWRGPRGTQIRGRHFVFGSAGVGGHRLRVRPEGPGRGLSSCSGPGLGLWFGLWMGTRTQGLRLGVAKLQKNPMSCADGHTASNAPDLFRPPKLSGAGPG